MAAATRSMSPGGALLRASRLFSLPKPIPPPANDIALEGAAHSDTATTTFPTHQIITTLPSARARGDWGLKRHLPVRQTTRTSTAMLRVKQVDSVEEITDYSSATDHGMTLLKFQEMNIPVQVPSRDSSSWTPSRSVFEEDGDITAIESDTAAKAEDHRWKFKGPWLAGMTEGEFQKWLSKSVRSRRPEFLKFLKAEISADTKRKALEEKADQGDAAFATSATEASADSVEVTDEQLMEKLRELRVDRTELYKLVGRFLDLAPLLAPDLSDSLDFMFPKEIYQTANPYAGRGPPATHPSAGLSYLRTASFMENHPLYGPQKLHAPVEARVVRPKLSMGSNPAILGVGGFITANPLNEDTNRLRNRGAPEMSNFDVNLKGGAKYYVHPNSATVDAKGRTVLQVDPGNAEATLIAKELRGQAKVLGVARDLPETKKLDAVGGSLDTTKTFGRFNPYSIRQPRSDDYGLSGFAEKSSRTGGLPSHKI